MIRFLYLLFWVLFLSVFHLHAQTYINKSKVIELKKTESRYWYADSAYNKDGEAIIDSSKLDSLNKKKKLKAKQVYNNPFQIEPETLGAIFNTIKWVAILFVLGAIVYVLITRKWKPHKFKDNESLNIVNENTIIETEEDLKITQFQDSLALAELSGNYRLATRLLFLDLLKLLVNLDYVRYHKKKTNEDYCQELIGRPFISSFRSCTDYYNKIWFGELNISISMYQKVKSSFVTLMDSLK
ncbi:MAG: hypothetical protein ACRCVT_00990 [Leadbetterella sp.]